MHERQERAGTDFGHRPFEQRPMLLDPLDNRLLNNRTMFGNQPIAPLVTDNDRDSSTRRKLAEMLQQSIAITLPTFEALSENHAVRIDLAAHCGPYANLVRTIDRQIRELREFEDVEVIPPPIPVLIQGFIRQNEQTLSPPKFGGFLEDTDTGPQSIMSTVRRNDKAQAIAKDVKKAIKRLGKIYMKVLSTKEVYEGNLSGLMNDASVDSEKKLDLAKQWEEELSHDLQKDLTAILYTAKQHKATLDAWVHDYRERQEGGSSSLMKVVSEPKSIVNDDAYHGNGNDDSFLQMGDQLQDLRKLARNIVNDLDYRKGIRANVALKDSLNQQGGGDKSSLQYEGDRKTEQKLEVFKFLQLRADGFVDHLEVTYGGDGKGKAAYDGVNERSLDYDAVPEAEIDGLLGARSEASAAAAPEIPGSSQEESKTVSVKTASGESFFSSWSGPVTPFEVGCAGFLLLVFTILIVHAIRNMKRRGKNMHDMQKGNGAFQQEAANGLELRAIKTKEAMHPCAAFAQKGDFDGDQKLEQNFLAEP